MQRPSKDDYYLNIALVVAQRCTCLRRRFGAVIVNDDEIISTGYVGAPRGTPNCIDLGECPRQKAKIPAGERYELCRSVHAEANAIISASRRRTIGGKLYLAGQDLENNETLVEAHPCKMCKRMIINAGIVEVITRTAQGGIKKWLVNDWIKNDLTEFTESNIKGY